MPRSRRQRVVLAVLKGVVYSAAILLALVIAALGLLETPWAKDQLRRVILQQARPYLTVDLQIDRLEGSFFRSIVLQGVRLSAGGRDLVNIERVELQYRTAELFRSGTTIQRVTIQTPRISAERMPDGSWDIASILNRRPQPRTGRRRPLHLPRIDVSNGDVELRTPVSFGAAHLPTRFASLNGRLGFDDDGTTWRVDLAQLSWAGSAPDLTMQSLTGAFVNRGGDLAFEELSVRTPGTAFVLNGGVDRTPGPAVFDLQVKAERFVFQEWSGILNGLKNIAVEAGFDAHLTGPLSKLAVDLDMRSTGGNVRGPFVLDTTIPGWHGAGSIDLERLNLARWLNREDRPSDISGRVEFDFALNLGHAPTGSYTFTGTHAAYFGYEADDIRATGTIVSNQARIASGSARAYGAGVTLTGSTISFDLPYAFRFAGRITEVDLRDVPANVPIPHVESTLTFDYDVTGRFSSPFVKGRARFEPSTFLGAEIGAGGSGTIDTSGSMVRYGGDVDLRVFDLPRFGDAFDVDWLRDPRYTGTLTGHFTIDAEGTSPLTMRLEATGRLTRGQFFGGTLSDADVSIRIAGASLDGSYDGPFSRINPAIPFDDPRLTASLSGSGRATIRVQDQFARPTTLEDYTIDAAVSLDGTKVRGVAVDRGRFEGRLAGATLSVSSIELTGSALDAKGAGRIELEASRASQFDYSIARADLGALEELIGRLMSGQVTTSGQLTGLVNAWRFAGAATLDHFGSGDVAVESATGSYDFAPQSSALLNSTGRVEGRATSIVALGQTLKDVSGTVSLAERTLDLNLTVDRSESFGGKIAGTMLLHPDGRSLEVSTLTADVQGSSWRLRSPGRSPNVSWEVDRVELDAMPFERVDYPDQLVSVSGAWRADGSGVLRATAARVFLDTFLSERPARYGGVIDGEVTLTGTLDRPNLSAAFTVSDGRIRELPYEKLTTRIDYQGGALSVDLRLDQAPGVWLTVAGRAPLDLFSERSEQPMDLAVNSSPIALGLLEGVTDVVQNVTGTMLLDFHVIGTSRDPHFAGRVGIENAAFLVSSSGSRYQKGRAAFRLGSDRVTVEAFHVEDDRGHPLELSGSLGTHELKVGDLEINVDAKGFRVLRNEFGTIDIDARLELRGVAESPRIEGRLTITSGELRVDEILDRALFRPYSMQAVAPPSIDAIAALNPWDRLGLNLELRIPGTLRMTGDEVQIRSGTPLGLGSFNLRAIGDLYLYKDPNDVMYVTGSLDSVSGTYAFQGRRFDIDPVSSINFRGDLDPELYVTVAREISGVLTHVTIQGSLRQPELQLTSAPPLDPSDVLSLIVFGTSTNSLSGTQQQQLAIRAGALAAGFLTTPLVGALGRSLGLSILEIEAPADSRSGPRVTVGDEIAPGLTARFSRQFGLEEYDEAIIEYICREFSASAAPSPTPRRSTRARRSVARNAPASI